ncbi:hypothetical protein ZIOFF_040316 [Zingiber officinale]|uniref:PROP1-like PPR domain-containing protein n=1 Tax=Zingiber officinale TaxID=94328 RepID=A0A8J5L4C2_ZINOF|nr:hypothetical protein ZIOFF_040316 [Zingiber officinale]
MNTIALYQLLAFLSTGGEAATSQPKRSSWSTTGSSREASEASSIKAQLKQKLQQRTKWTDQRDLIGSGFASTAVGTDHARGRSVPHRSKASQSCPTLESDRSRTDRSPHLACYRLVTAPIDTQRSDRSRRSIRSWFCPNQVPVSQTNIRSTLTVVGLSLPSLHTWTFLVNQVEKCILNIEFYLILKILLFIVFAIDCWCARSMGKPLENRGALKMRDRLKKNWILNTARGISADEVCSESISPNSFLLTELFKSGSRAPVPLKIASSAPDGSRRPRLAATYNTLIDLHGKAGKLQNASDAFAEMLRSGVSPDTITFNTMINICGSNGLISEAEALFDKMRRRRIVPDTKTFNIFMSMYASLGNIEAVLKYYHKMSESGLTPDTVSHRIILQALCERNMVREVEDVINKIIESGEFVDEQSFPVVVKMYINQGMLSETSMFLEKHCGSSSISSKNYAAIMDVYAEKGLWEEAEGVFYRKRGVGNKKEVVEYNVLIKAYGRGKQYDKAVSLFESMRNIGIWPDECTFNSLIQMLSGGDFPERATEFLRRMKDAGFRPRCETVSAIIASYSRKAMVDEALEIYQEMKPLGVEPNEVVYGLLVNMFAEAGKVEQALHFFSLMEESGFPPNHIILTSLMKAYKKASCWREAQEVYAKMKTLEHGPDTIASNCMIDLYAELGMVSEAKLIFDDLRKNGEVNGVSYTTMIYLYKSLGMLEEAIDMAQEVQKAGLLTDCASYNSVLAAYAVTGKLKDCAYLIHEMIARKMLPDASVFRSIFGIVKKGGLPIEAVLQLQASYNEGKQFAREAIVTTLFSLVGLHDHALESCNLFLSARTRNPLDSYAYNAAIYAYGASENIDKALNLYMRMQDAGLEPDTVTYVYLTICYGKARMVEGLRRIYGLLKYGEIEPSESLFKALMDAYENSGKHDLAELVEQEMKFRIHSPIGDESETEDDWDAYESETEDDLDAYESDNIDQDDDFSMNPSIL